MSKAASPEKKALLEAFDTVLKNQAEERERELRAAEARRRALARPRAIMSVGAAVVLFVAVYLWIERPEWVFPRPAAPESVAVKEASARIGVANAAQHLERFRQRSGRLPRTLAEAGAHGDGVVYQLTGDESWRMVGTNGQVQVTLESSEPLPKFLGNSFEVIARRSR